MCTGMKTLESGSWWAFQDLHYKFLKSDLMFESNWKLGCFQKCVAYTGNNMRKQTPISDKKEKDVSVSFKVVSESHTDLFVLMYSYAVCFLFQPFEVDLSHVYLAYTEESMRQSLMKLERPRTSKSGKSRPKTGRRWGVIHH